MRSTAFAIALLMSGAAVAQTMPDTGTPADTSVEADTTTTMDPMDPASSDMSTETSTSMDTSTHSTAHSTTTTAMNTQSSTTMATNMTPASEPIVQPGNANPEEDARGIAVISAAAMVPAGWNGISGTAVGGPLVDPTTGATMEASDASYPACSATVTDNCLQTYERGRSN